MEFPTKNLNHVFLGDGGEMGERIRDYDWAGTDLGPPETWPQSLKVAVRLMLTSRHPMFIWWGPDLIQFYNDAYRETMGPERHPSALGDRGKDCWAEIWPIIGPQIELVMQGQGSTWHENQLVPVTRHGGLQQVWWTYGYSPIDVEGGDVGGVLVVCKDVTSDHLVKEKLAEANVRLADDATRIKELFAQAPGFIVALRGPEHVFEFANAAYERLVGRDGLVGQRVVEALPEVVSQGFVDLLDTVYQTGKAHVGTGVRVQLMHEGVLKDRYVDFVYQPVSDADGAVTGIFVEGYDVTERIAAEQRQKLIAGEMGHRVKNILAMVEALVAMTGRNAKSIDDYRTRLTERIRAVVQTQTMLKDDLSQPVDVGSLIEAEIAPYLGAKERLTFTCDDIKVAPDDAVNVALIVHELLTNAAKYGALSTHTGRLTIRCQRGLDGGMIDWTETSEEVVVSEHEGFGTKLIHRLAKAMDGTAYMRMTDIGLMARITFRIID
jgi:two-component sensor histidine kinase